MGKNLYANIEGFRRDTHILSTVGRDIATRHPCVPIEKYFIFHTMQILATIAIAIAS